MKHTLGLEPPRRARQGSHADRIGCGSSIRACPGRPGLARSAPPYLLRDPRSIASVLMLVRRSRAWLDDAGGNASGLGLGWGQVIGTCQGWSGGVWCAGARPYLGARTHSVPVVVRSHDDRWGDPHAGERPLGLLRPRRGVSAGAGGWLGAGRREASVTWAGARTMAGAHTAVRAWSPSERRMWWERRTIFRATDRAARLPPMRSLIRL